MPGTAFKTLTRAIGVGEALPQGDGGDIVRLELDSHVAGHSVHGGLHTPKITLKA